MTVYDLAPFLNELDALLWRLHILDPVVDVFVVSEAEQTFGGFPKPLYLDTVWHDDLRPWWSKLRYIKVPTLPKPTASARDQYTVEDPMRKALLWGITDAADSDLVLISDVDEIPDPDQVHRHALEGRARHHQAIPSRPRTPY
jgi:beta-1,4-mannosyl-glycoprotein beta-1,4-N-acetylglucosaminyltransferase